MGAKNLPKILLYLHKPTDYSGIKIAWTDFFNDCSVRFAQNDLFITKIWINECKYHYL